MTSRVRVLSKRIMLPGKEDKVKRVMLDLESKVRAQPGFLRGEVLKDRGIANSYVILTEWESSKHLESWFKTDIYKSSTKALNDTLQKPEEFRILRKAKDDMFLL